MSQQKVILLLGSNLGETKKNIEQALYLINKDVGKVIKRTDFLKSIPVEYESCNIFCNIALEIATVFSPIKLLENLKKIERNIGREIDSAKTGRYMDRLIDIDIVSYNSLIFKNKKLKLPHLKHIKEREFSRKLLSALEN